MVYTVVSLIELLQRFPQYAVVYGESNDLTVEVNGWPYSVDEPDENLPWLHNK